MTTVKKISKQALSLLLTLVLVFSYGQYGLEADAAVKDSLVLLSNEELANGIHYTEEDIQNYANTPGYRVRFNHLVVDSGLQNVRIISGKAQDTVNAMETIGDQARREVLKGNHVVAGINADSYDMDYGSNRGIMVQNGDIVTSQPYNKYTVDQPAVWVDASEKVHISPLRVGGTIRAGVSYRAEADLINRNHFMGPAGYLSPANSTRVFTSSLTKDHTMENGAGTPPADQAYALVHIDGFSGYLHAGTEYKGKVAAIYSAPGFSIPDDCIVYAGYGTKAAEVRSLVKDMDVSYICHLYTGAYTENPDGTLNDRGILQDNAVTAVNSFQLLAQNGQLNHSVVDSVGTDKNARTVIGITKDGTVHVITIAKPSTYFSESSGSTMKDIANYMLTELQCTDVANMDGGGSTEMIARRAGDDDVATVSYPSDGSSRLVSNSLLFVSDTEKASAVGQVIVDKDINIYKGSHASFSFRLTDPCGNKISAQGRAVTWKAEMGAIDPNGNYTAPDVPGSDTVTAAVDGVTGEAKVRVVDLGDMASVGLSETGTVAVQKGDKKQFFIRAANIDHQEVLIDPSAAKWSVSDSRIGAIKDGLLTITADSGTATVSAEFGGKTYSVQVIVGLKEQTIDDFEQSPIEGYYLAGPMYRTCKSQLGGKSGMLGFEARNMPNSRVKDGSCSFRMTYDTANWPWDAGNQKRTSNGTANFFPCWDDNTDSLGNGHWGESQRAAMESRYTAKAMPKKFGMWVYSGDENNDGVSDNKDCMLGVFFYADCVGGYKGENSAQSKNITLTGSMDWIGWKYLEADIPQDWQMPIVFNYFYFSNTKTTTKPTENYKTDVLFDDLKFIYTDDGEDQSGPVFSNTTPNAGGYYRDELNFSTTVTDTGSGVDPSSISVSVNGNPVTDYRFDALTGKLSFSRAGLQNGSKYRVIVKASDRKGNAAVPYIDNTYAVDLTPDREGPVISQVTPLKDVTVQIPRPRITFNLLDQKSSVNSASISVKLGGKNCPVYYDAKTGWGYALPTEDFTAGDYSLTIDAKDTVGNAMTQYTDTIEIKPILQPKDPNNFKVTVIPDTQGNAYSDRIFARAAKDGSDFIVHLGDITDGATQAEYTAGRNYIASLGKPGFVLAGNHEAFNGDLNLYYKTFGSPTYHFAYGNTLFIVLNSAFGQSVDASDSTQYHYLEDVLKNNKLPNVYVFNHVITRDDFSTAHNMDPAEADKFESVMSAYKASHPQSNVNVIFGHLHCIHNWTVGGVNYIIGGNAAGKEYVSHEQGNILGTGTILVKNGAASYVYDPLLTRTYIQNDALVGTTLRTFQSAKLQLNLFGDFREYPSDYITQLNTHELIGIAWTSSNPDVVSVDSKGVITALKMGTAQITALCGGKTYRISIESLDPAKADAADIRLTLPNKTTVGQTVLPTVAATDPYGTVFALPNQAVHFDCRYGRMAVQNDGSLLAKAAGTEEVTAHFRNRASTASMEIDEAQIPGGNGGSHSSTRADSKKESSTGDAAITVSREGNKTVAVVAEASALIPSVAGGSADFTMNVPEAASQLIQLATSQAPVEVHICVPTLDLEQQMGNAAVGTVALNLQIPSNIANNTNPNARVILSLPAEVLRSARDTQKDLRLTVTDSQSGKALYTWFFSGKELRKSDAAGSNLDLNISMTSAAESKFLAAGTDSAVRSKGVALHFAPNGLLPAPASVRVYAAGQADAAPGTAMIPYYCDPVAGTLERVTQLPLTVDAQGYVTLPIAHCSDYLLLPARSANEYPVHSDTGLPIEIQQNKFYTFAVIADAGAKPFFSVGNGKAFFVRTVWKNGKYYVTVKAVGQPGAVSALYSVLPGKKPVNLCYLKSAK